ncbi:MAG: radical SAM protein [Bacteroidales bacterium]|nr:radical SAM protein [Bacteroidales bacterium]
MNDLSRAHFSEIKHLFCSTSLLCNKSCGYCYLPSKSRKNKYSIPLNELVKYLLIFKKLNVGYVTLVGGEPALLENFNIITQTISDLGFNLIVHTNGSLSKEQLFHLTKLRVVYISFSLDSLDPKINDTNRFKGATEEVIRKIDETSSFNLPIRISTVITKENMNDIYPLVRFAETKNINLINIHRLEILNHQTENVKNISLSPEEWITQFKDWLTVAKETKIFLRAPISFMPLKYVLEIKNKNIDCPSKYYDTFNLFPSGNVYRCPLLVNENIFAWNIKNQNILSESPKDKSLFEENKDCNGMCPIIIKRYNTQYKEFFPVCPFIKTTLNPLGGVSNGVWDEIVFDFI